MVESTALAHGSASKSEHGGSDHSALEKLRHAIHHAQHLLPAQGPITVFVHHNTLHAFEELTFHEAVQKGSKVFGCHPYLPEERYRAKLARSRIERSDIAKTLRDDLGERGLENITPFVTRFRLRQLMMEHTFRTAKPSELLWYVAESNSLRRLRADVSPEARQVLLTETKKWALQSGQASIEASPSHNAASHQSRQAILSEIFDRQETSKMESWNDSKWESFSVRALWKICRTSVKKVRPHKAEQHLHLRLRDDLLEVTHSDPDQVVNELMIRMTASYLDQGLSGWPMPIRELGFFEAFQEIYGMGAGPPNSWLSGLKPITEDLRKRSVSAFDSILESLNELDISPREYDDYITATLLALRGWGGMVNQVETRPDRVSTPIRDGSLVDFLAVRLILDRLAAAHVAREELGFRGSLRELREMLHKKHHHGPAQHQPDQRAFLVFELAQVAGWTPAQLIELSVRDWNSLFEEIESFSSVERRRIFQLAFEAQLRDQALDAILLRQRDATPATPRFQLITCIDEREESFRRHLEEIAPDCETFGAAGFFSVAIYYRGAADAHFVPLCPVVVKPNNWVVEIPRKDVEIEGERRAKTRKALGKATHQVHVGSRSLAMGAVLTAGLGVLASIPLVARVLFPRTTSLFKRKLSSLVRPPEATELVIERQESTPGCENGHVGYSLDEMTNVAERLLRDIGLTQRFARTIAILGHGSNSLNNPHKSAYDCGACGGGAGGPNARALAKILNDVRVRSNLVPRGISIPAGTVFVGGFHNTCNDSVSFFDIDQFGEQDRKEFEYVQQKVEMTCERNAHERCRRFMSAPLNMTTAAARRHVEARAEDLAQTRPECGHATNAICMVGRRNKTRGLYFDRRAFLVSYDPTQDSSDAAILTRIMQAVFPVCGGINLEYYFSYVDSPGWGCGTKLPHNVTSLLGVMDGAGSDLRTGLPWQMVEIHEPVRLLFIVEATPETLDRIMDANPPIARLVRNDWVQLVSLDPQTGTPRVYRNGRYEIHTVTKSVLPTVSSSIDWYRGHREHLKFAEIQSVQTARN